MKGWKDKLVCVSQTVEYQSMEERERERNLFESPFLPERLIYLCANNFYSVVFGREKLKTFSSARRDENFGNVLK